LCISHVEQIVANCLCNQNDFCLVFQILRMVRTLIQSFQSLMTNLLNTKSYYDNSTQPLRNYSIMWRTWKRASIGKVNTTQVKRQKYWIFNANYQIWITKFLQLPSPTTGRVHNNDKRRVSLVVKELLALPEHLSSPQVFSGVRVTRSLVWYVCFVDRCLSFCTFSFDHCVVCPSSIYGVWLPLWYLQTLLVSDGFKTHILYP